MKLLFQSLLVTSLMSPLLAWGTYSPGAPMVVSKTCTTVIHHPGGEVRPDFDELQRIVVQNLAARGYDPYVEFNYFGRSKLLTMNAAQAKMPAKFLYGNLDVYLDGWTSKDPQYCPAGQAAIGIKLVYDVRPLGNYHNGYFSSFKNRKESVPQVSKFVCLPEPYSLEQWQAARKSATADLASVTPTCQQWWQLNQNNFSINTVEINPAKPGLSIVPAGKCVSVDNLDQVEINLYTLKSSNPVGSLVFYATANGQPAATTTVVPKVFFGPAVGKIELYAPFGYIDRIGKTRVIDGFFTDKFSSHFTVTTKDSLANESVPWPGLYRERTFECNFQVNEFKF